VTVIDPRHGLAGQRLELVSSRSARGPAFVVVRLADGRRRSIRRAVTDLAVASAEEQSASKPLARINVRTLLTLLHHLNRTLASPIEEVIRDEHPVESVPRRVPDSQQSSEPEYHYAAKSLARPAREEADADRTGLRAASHANAIDGRADQGGSAC
jgi:hypothetical protein